MTLVELIKIEQILKENINAKLKAKKLFDETMREKYNRYDWFTVKMNNAEKEQYDILYKEYAEANSLYKSFIEHNWQ